MKYNIYNLSLIFNNGYCCKKILENSKLLFIGYWKCDNCMTKELEKTIGKALGESLFKKRFAQKIIGNLRKQANKNSSFSPNNLEIFINSYNSLARVQT